ncbi:hypothetical protein CLV47_101299 [Antricoccus suffuscus]|uniref:Uncharacterized protein n=1 Tax=Antricoccus suffuscus TaxID=1629062 RepID=A0A2T1A6J3_9ACTN|nr:hypothetical protein CLV47_101299 [Antricoccus suffuscus]
MRSTKRGGQIAQTDSRLSGTYSRMVAQPKVTGWMLVRGQLVSDLTFT